MHFAKTFRQWNPLEKASTKLYLYFQNILQVKNMFMRYNLSKVGHMDGSSTTLSGDNNLTKDFKEYQKCFFFCFDWKRAAHQEK